MKCQTESAARMISFNLLFGKEDSPKFQISQTGIHRGYCSHCNDGFISLLLKGTSLFDLYLLLVSYSFAGLLYGNDKKL